MAIRPTHKVTIAGVEYSACMTIDAIDTVEEQVGAIPSLLSSGDSISLTSKQMAHIIAAATDGLDYAQARELVHDSYIEAVTLTGQLLSDVLAPDSLTDQAIEDAGGTSGNVQEGPATSV